LHVGSPTFTTCLLAWKIYFGRVVVLHETIHELKRKKQKGLILGLDFEKAYDKVNCGP
jgi:hypothetical protein